MVPIIAGIKTKKEYSLILDAWVKGCFFKATDKNGNMTKEDEKFKKDFGENPLHYLSCDFDGKEYSEIYDGVHVILEKMNFKQQ